VAKVAAGAGFSNGRTKILEEVVVEVGSMEDSAAARTTAATTTTIATLVITITITIIITIIITTITPITTLLATCAARAGRPNSSRLGRKTRTKGDSFTLAEPRKSVAFSNGRTRWTEEDMEEEEEEDMEVITTIAMGTVIAIMGEHHPQ
jgi:hypothetical protein